MTWAELLVRAEAGFAGQSPLSTQGETPMSEQTNLQPGDRVRYSHTSQITGRHYEIDATVDFIYSNGLADITFSVQDYGIGHDVVPISELTPITEQEKH